MTGPPRDDLAAQLAGIRERVALPPGADREWRWAAGRLLWACDELERCDAAAQALRAALHESLTYVEMAGGADNSGEEYPLQCQSCGGTGANRHYHDCRLVTFERRVSEILAQPTAGA